MSTFSREFHSEQNPGFTSRLFGFRVQQPINKSKRQFDRTPDKPQGERKCGRH